MFRKAIVLIVVMTFILGSFALAGADRSGRDVYERSCKMCHGTGFSGAPAPGDEDWAYRLEAHGGIDGLTEMAIKGKNAMPPKGACMDCTEAEIKAAIQYMIDER